MRETEVYTEKLRQAGIDSGSVHDILAGLVGDADAASGPWAAAWGPDKFGQKFAQGDGSEQNPGFIAQFHDVVGGTSRLADSFGEISRGKFTAAQEWDRDEQSSADNF